MKNLLLTIIALFYMGIYDAAAQGTHRGGNKFYVQAGAGLNIYNHLQQVGFTQQSNAYTGYIEVGQERGLWRFGGFLTQGQTHQYFVHTLTEDHMGIYGKLNLGPFIRVLPFGIDPYLYGSSSMSHATFTTDDFNQPDDPALSQVLTNSNVKYNFGGGIDIGSKLVILGLHYTYTPGQETFVRPESNPISFLTSQHHFEVRLGLRLYPHFSKNSVRCPRMTRRGKGQLFF